MPEKDPNNFNWLSVALILIMTQLGMIASYANKLLKEEKFKWRIFFLQMIIALFSGALVCFGCSYFNLEPELSGAISGLSGWSGASFIKILEVKFLRKINNG